MKCRLCCQDRTLKKSHLVPKMFFNYIKKHSKTYGMRQVHEPNIRVQDGLKVPFLCEDCEEKFSKYETYFSNKFFLQNYNDYMNFRFDTDCDELRYFLLSIAWRTLQYTVETDEKMLKSFSDSEKNQLFQTLENWRKSLFYEDITIIKGITQYFIPTIQLSIFEQVPNEIRNNISIDFRVMGNVDSFECAFTYIKVPFFIFICNTWGSIPQMETLSVGEEIVVRNYQLPQLLLSLLSNHYNNFQLAKEKITPKQIESIHKRAIQNQNDK